VGLSCQIEATTATTKTKDQIQNMKLIESNTTLTARSICDYDCIFSLKVLNRKGSFATIRFQGNEKRVKVRNDGDREYVKPNNYSMAPIFRAA
jgi:hypothetical protein